MTHRERIRTIVSGKPADRCGFWTGNPHRDSWPALFRHLNAHDPEGVYKALDDDCRWLSPWDAYHHPAGKPMFDMQRKSHALSAAGVFAETESTAEVEDFEWPNPDYLDFTDCFGRLKNAGDCYRLGGMWCHFFHIVADFFGMENYFIKMYTHPEVVHAVTSHVVDFFLEANRRLYVLAGSEIDAFFFGNDFGTQLDLLISPGLFREFVFPYFDQLTAQAHSHGYQVVLHSCGSIHRVIPDIIEMGVQALHPLQAKAANMEAERLAADFGGQIAFIGGIDTQDLLVNGSPEEVAADVKRVMRLLGPSLVVSPSHEALLPNVSPQNIEAMRNAVYPEQVEKC